MSGYNFTNDVRLALESAREEAATLRHSNVDAGHLLLGLLRHPGAVCGVLLRQLSLNEAELVPAVRRGLGPPDDEVGGPDLPYTATGKRVLQHAMEEAAGLGHNFVGTEHLLLGLIRLNQQPLREAFAAAGVALEPARAALRAISPPGTVLAESTVARRAFVVALIALAVAITALALALRS